MFGKPIEAVIFDMDGTLIDSEAVYISAMREAAQSLGLEMSLAFCHSMIGIPRRECNEMIQGLYGPTFDLAHFRGIYSGIVERRMAEGIPVKTGVVEMLDFLDRERLPRAVATAANRPTTENRLGRAGLLKRFDAVVTRDDVVHAKPAPDLFLEAARRLGIAPESCLALEDSTVGVTAAHAAGMMTIMVPDILQPSEELRAKALHVAESLHAVRTLLEAARV
ncbi:MAG TPA: HAD family phosphatase [Reyranella sp.]|nr:HAD family phosphatase [Reyranella sp.]